MTRRTLWTVIIAAAAGVAATLAVLWSAGLLVGLAPPAAAPPPAPAETPGIVTVNPHEVAASGIAAAALRSTTTRASSDAVATIVDLSPLADLITNVSSTSAQWRASAARSAASNATYMRDKTLFADDQNVSRAELQSAEASASADRAAADAARTSLDSARFALQQQFGPVIGRWPLGAVGRALARHHELLVQVSTPSDLGRPPKHVRLSTPGGESVTAHFVSAAVRTDPRVQGSSFFYVAPARPDLLAGATVSVALPQGPKHTGAVVPADAIVVWQGESWAYKQMAPGRFRRIPVKTQLPVEGGYLDTMIAPGTVLVTRGAQLLLSQELQPPPGAASTGGDDDG